MWLAIIGIKLPSMLKDASRQHDDIFANRRADGHNITDEGQAIKNSESHSSGISRGKSCIALSTMCIGPIQLQNSHAGRGKWRMLCGQSGFHPATSPKTWSSSVSTIDCQISYDAGGGPLGEGELEGGAACSYM